MLNTIRLQPEHENDNGREMEKIIALAEVGVLITSLQYPDREIIQLRLDGYTFNEINQHLKIKNSYNLYKNIITTLREREGADK